MISDERWKDKDAVLREIGAPILSRPIEETLTAFREELEKKFALVNQRIESRVNRHINIRGAGDKRRWTLVYPSEEEPINGPSFGELPTIGIADLLWFVHQETNFLSAFTHVLDRFVKHDLVRNEILACLIAFGTNMGLWKMAEVSDLSYLSLRATTRNYIRLETLRAANDFISNALARLPMFQHYDIQETIHSRSDGQRIETQIDTINARFSSKYFGLKKGISSYTLLANHVPINAKTIGAQEHEIDRSGCTTFRTDARQIRLADFHFRLNERFLYEYDFRDLWQHQIRLEAMNVGQAGKAYPVCIAGARAAPPEDCDGPWAVNGSP